MAELSLSIPSWLMWTIIVITLICTVATCIKLIEPPQQE